jgi:hypothetical protein
MEALTKDLVWSKLIRLFYFNKKTASFARGKLAVDLAEFLSEHSLSE